MVQLKDKSITQIDKVTINDHTTIIASLVQYDTGDIIDSYVRFHITGPNLQVIDLGAGSPGYSGHACMQRDGATVVFGWVEDIDPKVTRPIEWHTGEVANRIVVSEMAFTLDSPGVYADSDAHKWLVDANEVPMIAWTQGTDFEDMKSALEMAAWLAQHDMV